MSASILSQASAFNPGSDLWIVPTLEKSHWTAQMDWYLNFQICKSSRHQHARISRFVDSVLEQTELDKFNAAVADDAPLMIASERLLPNKWVVVLPWTEDLDLWNKKISKIWADLKNPSLRIFLPPGLNAGNFQKSWAQLQSHQDFTLVLD